LWVNESEELGCVDSVDEGSSVIGCLLWLLGVRTGKLSVTPAPQ